MGRIVSTIMSFISTFAMSSLALADSGRTPGANCSLTSLSTGKTYYTLVYAGSYDSSRLAAAQKLLAQCRIDAGAAADQACPDVNVGCTIAYRT